MDFGFTSVGSSVTRTFVVTNRGGADATVLGVGTALSAGFGFGLTGSGAYPGGTGTTTVDGTVFNYCGTALAKGARCAVLVHYTPASSGLTSNSALNLAYSDANGAINPNGNRFIFGRSP